MFELDWNFVNVNELYNITEKSGVYMLVVKNNGETHKVKYIGSSSNIYKTTMEHISIFEKDPYVKELINSSDNIYVYFSEISEQEILDGIVVYLFNVYRTDMSAQIITKVKEVKCNVPFSNKVI